VWRHTGYKRVAKNPDGQETPVAIDRYRCGECWLVVSGLFMFLIPYVQYTSQSKNGADCRD
jgi:hypothetical protein